MSRGERDLAEALAERAGVPGAARGDRVALCAAVAEWLARPEGLREARRLQAAGALDDVLAAAAAPPPAAERPPGLRAAEPIGHWRPAEIDGERVFVADHLGAREVLRPKRAELPLRVGLFGESVAAGYLYAPWLTPAQILEGQLRAAVGRDDFEVIDLARTSERLATLAEAVRASLQVQPDLLVLFAGNNWNLLETPEVSPYAPRVRARQRYAERLRAEGLRGPVRLAQAALRARCAEAFERIATIAGAVQVPVVVVLPEVNLADWESRQPVPRLGGDGVARWYALGERAGAALARGDFAAAAEAAEAMLALDGG
ncbi:MAG TPA: hypothetical protein VF121_10075, partial [Thermoanaerobaculia bacterium]|nr:hypothetical protein [Thermoanaerobaculia bacterium]